MKIKLDTKMIKMNQKMKIKKKNTLKLKWMNKTYTHKTMKVYSNKKNITQKLSTY